MSQPYHVNALPRVLFTITNGKLSTFVNGAGCHAVQCSKCKLIYTKYILNSPRIHICY